MFLLRTMSKSSLSPATAREVSLLNSRLTSIESEIRTFAEKKYCEINEIKERINLLSSPSNGSKRTSSSDTETNCKKLKTDPENFSVKDGFTQVYTDGACPNNGRGAAKAGIGVWWGEGHVLNVSRRVVGDKQTNNVAEIQAAAMAVSQAKIEGIKKLEINTDSKFVIDCITKWVANWKRKGWTTAQGEPVINKEDLVKLDSLVGSGSVEVKWTHVKGHSDNYGNNQADKLAVAGANM